MFLEYLYGKLYIIIVMNKSILTKDSLIEYQSLEEDSVEEIKKKLLTIPIGYGYVTLGYGKLAKDSDWGGKINDLVIQVAMLPERSQPNQSLNKDMEAFAKSHVVLQLPISKDYVPKLIQILTEYLHEEDSNAK